ncbi:MAG TPA: 23S rRNA (uracil(1939)-C(5))-methyltransferase RlmD [Ginsengibacter sp.]|nr:23S rRNA (uracil(1939)-C(5))-methyltransferase RlmD [Ginsengibacter sp.]HRP17605.1 23S rRNA (uracil(1939)-C(5))-methyltransferase RlmD [Ginsengibacter sp.]
MRKKKIKPVITDVAFTGYAALGKAIARPEGKVLFADGVVPGDVADIQITKNKKDWAEGRLVQLKQESTDRIPPLCKHFGTCGGCQWQMLPYSKQLAYKQTEAEGLFRKQKIEAPVLPIIGSDLSYEYRNKLEFTFSDREFLTQEDFKSGVKAGDALGYHISGFYDKVLNITECHLMNPVNDRIRNGLRDFAVRNKMPFYNVKIHEGWLRNMVIRYSTLGQCMVNIVISKKHQEWQQQIEDFLHSQFPEITTLLFTENTKLNDSLYDLEPEIAYGPGVIYEQLGALQFKISPQSFFQTNSFQARKLYDVVKNFARLQGTETVYDLYCGTGSIGLYLADNARQIIGVETIPNAIKDAEENASLNHISHARFFTGDVIRVCNDGFFKAHGKPDLVIVDPPRAGLHESLINQLLAIQAPRIVYVSCNIGTQARDLQLLDKKYDAVHLQPVDMFPQTYHIECVAELTLKARDTLSEMP